MDENEILEEAMSTKETEMLIEAIKIIAENLTKENLIEALNRIQDKGKPQ